MIRTAIVLAALLVIFTAWFVPKYNEAQHIETPCVRLGAGFYYCDKSDILQKYLDIVKSNPNFNFTLPK